MEGIRHNTSAQSAILGMLSLLTSSAAADSDLAERVRGLLVAQELAAEQADYDLSFAETVSVRSHNLPDIKRAVQWRIQRRDGRLLRSRRSDDVRGQDPSYVVVERPDGFYYAVHAEGKWSAYRTAEPTVQYDTCSSQELYSAPLGNRETWLGALKSRSIIECEVSESRITLVLAFIPAIASGLRDGTLKAGANLQGTIGWRCHLTREDNGYRLRAVEQIETTQMRVPSGEPGNMTWVPHTGAIDSAAGPLKLADGTEVCVTKRVTFDGFRLVAKYAFPTKASVVSRFLRSDADVSEPTIQTDQQLPAADFECRPPEDFGKRGMYTDLDTEETTIQGVASSELEKSARQLAETGRDLARHSATWERWPWWGIACAGLAGLALGFGAIRVLVKR